MQTMHLAMQLLGHSNLTHTYLPDPRPLPHPPVQVPFPEDMSHILTVKDSEVPYEK